MRKKKKILGKILVIIFLILIAVGFTIPGFLNQNGEEPVEPTSDQRLCQGDSDCYLMCDEIPIEVLCAGNLCQQNACDEYVLYPYQEEPITFELTITNESLEELSNPSDIFIKFSGDTVQMFTELSLSKILEKINYDATGTTLDINGQESIYYGSYVPEEGDVIKIY